MPDNPANTLGTPEHAAFLTKDRAQSTRDAMQWLAFSHLPKELQDFSRPFYQTAMELLFSVPVDSHELDLALDALIHAKDCAMRAGIRAKTGRAGSVPRPQVIVDPPRFEDPSKKQ